MASKIRAIFPAPIISIAFLLLASLSLAQSQDAEKEFNCTTHPPFTSFDVAKMAGDWYAIARSPAAEMPACVHIIAPASGVDGNCKLQVEYVTSFGPKFKRIKGTMIFPWADVKRGVITQTGKTYKFILVDPENVVMICGYGPKEQFGMLLTRALDKQKELMYELRKLLNDTSLVEQSSKCDGAAALIPTLMGLLTSVLVLAVRS